MSAAGMLLIAGALLNSLLTGFSAVNGWVAAAGLLLIIITIIRKTSLGKKLLPERAGINGILSTLIIGAVVVALVVVPLALVTDDRSNQELNRVLKKSAALAEQGEYDQAYALLEQYANGDDIPEIMQNKAAVLIRKGESGQAAELLSQVALYKNIDATMLFNTGLCYYQNGSYKDAVDYFEKALLLDPEMWLCCSYAGEAYYRLKNYRSAEYFYSEALKIAPDNPNIHYRLAKVKMDKMEYVAATKLLTQAESYDMSVELAAKVAELEQAIRYYRELTEDMNK